MAGVLGVESHLLVRWIHVVAMGLMVGGTAVVWGLLRNVDEGGIAAAVAYERLFWGAVGLAVLTGVGNLGALAPFVPEPTSAWGTTFTVKLVAVGGLLAGSLVRTLAVLRWRTATGPAAAPRPADRPAQVYAATTVYLVGLVALAEVLAHG